MREVRIYLTRRKDAPDGYTTLDADGNCTYPGCEYVHKDEDACCDRDSCDEAVPMV